MVILAHFKKQKLEEQLQNLIGIKNKYTRNEYGVEQELEDLLEKAASYFKQIGKSSLESQVSTLRIYITTAMNGIDPQTFELVRTNKRKIVKSASFYCLSGISSIFENELDAVNALLDDSEKTLSQIILSLVQSGGMEIEDILKLNTLSEISSFWKSIISQNMQIQLIDMQLRQNILSEDIHLLVQNVINNLKSQ